MCRQIPSHPVARTAAANSQFPTTDNTRNEPRPLTLLWPQRLVTRRSPPAYISTASRQLRANPRLTLLELTLAHALPEARKATLSAPNCAKKFALIAIRERHYSRCSACGDLTGIPRVALRRSVSHAFWSPNRHCQR